MLTGEYAMSFVHAMQQRSTDGQYQLRVIMITFRTLE
jgi:hypothetical protein